MDWGLGHRQHGFLREHLMFKRRWVYYGAIVTDFLLRFLWMYQLVPIDFLPHVRVCRAPFVQPPLPIACIGCPCAPVFDSHSIRRADSFCGCLCFKLLAVNRMCVCSGWTPSLTPTTTT